MLLIDSTTKDLTPWLDAFRMAISEKEVITWDQIVNPHEVKMAVLWNHREDLFESLPHLELVASLGAGVDHILSDPLLPDHTKVSKVISPHLSGPMSNFCIGAVLYFHKQFDKYGRDKLSKNWDQEFDPERPLRIGIMGMGSLGKDLAGKLLNLGFQVYGLNREQRPFPGMETFGQESLDTFLMKINTLICMLPATEETKGIINYQLLSRMPKGSFLINVGRGQQQIDDDIVRALDEGILDGAFLDVFPQEPLPQGSRL